MKRTGELRRVLVGLAHGGHAIVDGAPGESAAVAAGAVPLSVVTQEPDVADPESTAQAVAAVGTTDFKFLFPALADDPASRLPADSDPTIANTVAALNDLGNAMVEPNPATSTQNSPIPPVYTYWGQFVDHDLTAATDNDDRISIRDEVLPPLTAAEVTALLTNARNPALNLDSVYGDGPFAPPPGPGEIAVPYLPQDRAKLQVGELTPTNVGVRIPPVEDMARDLPRIDTTAQIGDGRNDENLVVAQLHVAFLRFHNAAVDWVRVNEPERTGVGDVFGRARNLTRWTYQWLCIHDYLATVTAAGTVDQVLTSDDDDLLDLTNRGTYMPLEFSVAAFRFGHSMIRSAYDWNRNFGLPGNNTAPRATLEQLFQFTGNARPPFSPAPGIVPGTPTLPSNWPIEWNRFVDSDSQIANRFARRIDTQLAPPLTEMINQVPVSVLDPRLIALLKHLARRNLLRGFRLGLPTGQAVAGQLGVTPLDKTELEQDTDQATTDALTKGGFFDRTPLWFYILKESEVRANGNTLGEVGSRIVAETIIGQIRHDPNSYLRQSSWSPSAGVRLPNGSSVRSIPDFLRFAGVL